MADEVASSGDGDPPPWPEEDPPDEHHLYFRVHRNWYKDGVLEVGCFKNRPDPDKDGMSTDWCKYRTAERSRQAAKAPDDNAIIAFDVGRVKKIEGQRVKHTPIFDHPTEEDNRAHTDVRGAKTPRTRVEFRKIHRVVLPLSKK